MENKIPPFVKKFDFRGIYNEDIRAVDAYYVGLAVAKAIPLKKVLIGWDTRDSSKHLALHFMSALAEKKVEMVYMDKCPIDYVAAGAVAFDFDLSVMFTGSHNPWNWTGILMHTKGGDSLQGELVNKIIEYYYEADDIVHLDDEVVDITAYTNFYPELESVYVQKLKELIPLEKIKEQNVLVDVGDGSGSRSLTLLETLLPQVKFSRIHDRTIYNGSSAHIADPSQIGTMKELTDKMHHGAYDGGFAFDSDADRVLAVDEKGAYLNGSQLGSALAECFIKLGLSHKNMGYSVDCGPSLPNALHTFKQVNTASLPVGRSIIRTMLRDGSLDFGAENVGHFYVKDFFMTDSGVFALAAILYWMSENGPLSSLDKKYPDGNREHLFIPVEPTEGNTIEHLSAVINKRYEEKMTEEKIEVDGTRYEFSDDTKVVSWYAVRKSGYEQVEKYYFGSLEEEEFKFLHNTFEELFEKKRKTK